MTDIKKPLPVAAGKGFTVSSCISHDGSEEDNLTARLSRYYIAKNRAKANREYLEGFVSDNQEGGTSSFMELLRAIIEKSNGRKNFNPKQHDHILGVFRHVLDQYMPGVSISDKVPPTAVGYVDLANELAAQFDRYSKAAKGIGGCGNYLVFHQYYTVGTTKLSKASFCRQHLICPLCAIRRGAKTLESYLQKYKIVTSENVGLRMSMITLTVKNGGDLKERFEHLKASQNKLFQRRRDWLKKGWGKTEFKKIHGWVGTHEVTNKGKGWHPHSHIMVLHYENFNYSNLIREWKEVTGDSCNINVTEAQHPEEPEKDFIEVFKYAVKFSDLSAELNIHAWDVLRGKRLLFSGGLLHGVEVPESLTDELIDDLPYIELFYKATLTGYQLESSEMKEPDIPDVEILPFSKVSLDYLSNRVTARLSERGGGTTMKEGGLKGLDFWPFAARSEERTKSLRGVSNQSDFKLGYDSFSASEKPPRGKRIQFYKGWNKRKSDLKLEVKT